MSFADMHTVSLHPASFRGVPFLVVGSEISGGRKDAKKEFVDSDLQNIEDLGLKQRIYNVQGVVSEKSSTSGSVTKPYLQARDDILDALEKGGTGILIHPWYGRIENIVCREFQLSETTTRLGDGQLTIVFEISNTDGVPVATQFVLTKVALTHEAVVSAAEISLGTLWNVTSGIFQDGLDKANSFIAAVNSATAPVASLASKINEHASLISAFSSNVASLIAAPVQLADSVNNIMFSVGGLFSTSGSTLRAFEGLFDFGDGDPTSSMLTSESIQRSANTAVFTSTVQATALSFAYLSASQDEYETVADIVEVASRLEIQFRKLFDNPNVDSSVIEALIELRTTTQGFFDEQKLTASQVTEIEVKSPLSARLIAYQYYGSSERGPDIAELNGLFDLYSTEGQGLRIFTK